MSRPRVLQVFPYWLEPETGGASGVKDVIASIVELTRDDWDHVVVTPGASPHNERFRSAGAVDVVDLGRRDHLVVRRGSGAASLARHSIDIARESRRLAALIRGRDIAVVHSHSSAYLGGALAARLTGRPSLVHVHERMDRLPRVVAWGHRRVTATLADRIVVLARFMEDEWHDAARKLETIPNTVIVRSPGVAEDGGTVPIGFLGRIAPRKGIEYLIDALALVRDEIPDARLAVVGGPAEAEDYAYLERLRSQATSLGSAIEFRGPTDDPLGFLRNVCVLAFVSPVDIAPVTVLQAMALGVPVVSGSHGGAEEFVVDGVTGVVVPPRDARALAAALVDVLQHAECRAQMSQAARTRFGELYGPERFRAQISELYERALLKRRGSAPRLRS